MDARARGDVALNALFRAGHNNKEQEIEPSPILSHSIGKELSFSSFQIVIGKEEIPITSFVSTVYAGHCARRKLRSVRYGIEVEKSKFRLIFPDIPWRYMADVTCYITNLIKVWRKELVGL